MNNEIQNGEVLFESNYTRTPELVYVMQKEFTKGSPEELFAFLKSKNIKCK